jgi:predicted AAA+ superfamily ATPase
MSWWEKLDRPTGGVSLAGLFDGERPKTDLGAAPRLDTVIDNLLRPGFPAMVTLAPAQSAARLRGYIDDVARTDLRRIAAIRHKPEVVKQLIAGLARSVATEASVTAR